MKGKTMKMRMMMAAVALAIAGLATPALAEPDFPALTGRVVDTADEIPADQEAKLVADLKAYEMRTGHQLVVVTVPDLKGYDKADYAIALGRKWGIGRKGVDDGVLLLRSPGDGKPGSGRTFIATGYGQEPYMTDAETGRIYNDIMRPILLGETGTSVDQLPKPQRAAPAILAGVAEIIRIGSITPEQKADDERRLAMENARHAQAVKDGFLTFLTWVGGILATIAGAFGIYWTATAKKRAEAKRLEEERLAELAKQRAEERRLQKIEDERRAEAERQRVAAAAAARAAMLAAMTPVARQAFLDKERREAEEEAERQRQAAAERERLRRIEEAAAAKRRAEQEAEDERDHAAAAAIVASSPSPSPTSYDFGGGGGGDSFSGGGGSFGGGGAGGND